MRNVGEGGDVEEEEKEDGSGRHDGDEEPETPAQHRYQHRFSQSPLSRYQPGLLGAAAANGALLRPRYPGLINFKDNARESTITLQSLGGFARLATRKFEGRLSFRHRRLGSKAYLWGGRGGRKVKTYSLFVFSFFFPIYFREWKIAEENPRAFLRVPENAHRNEASSLLCHDYVLAYRILNMFVGQSDYDNVICSTKFKLG